MSALPLADETGQFDLKRDFDFAESHTRNPNLKHVVLVILHALSLGIDGDDLSHLLNPDCDSRYLYLLFLDVIHFGLKPRMKLHEIQCHFREFPHRLQSTDVVLVLRPYKILISRTRTRTSTKRIRLNRMHTPCAFSYFPHSAFQLPNSWHPYVILNITVYKKNQRLKLMLI